MSFQEFLQYASGPGVNVIWGFILTVIVEWFPRWEELESRIKRAVFFVASMAVPVTASLISVAANYQDFGFDTVIWPALVAGFACFSAGTVSHIRKL